MICPRTPTVCLNMIVRNEAAIIRRALRSVLGFVDCACICDTGSEDDTVGVIHDFCREHHLPVRVFTEPFRDFAWNRNAALRACLGMSDFVLLMDADMLLEWKGFDKASLWKGNCFQLYQGSPNLKYTNTRIIRNNGRFLYHGATHEYLDEVPPSSTPVILEQEDIRIVDKGDGGCKDNKFERDIRLLTASLDKNPDDPRAVFYLANSFFDVGRFEEAIKWYTKRTRMGGWFQEIWVSYTRIARAHVKLQRPEMAEHFFWMAYETDPRRTEALLELIRLHRNAGRRTTASALLTLCRDRPVEKTRQEFLFYDNTVYTHMIDFEHTILDYYTGKLRIGLHAKRVLDHCTCAVHLQCMIANMRFYKWSLPAARSVIDVSRTRRNGDMLFRSSSPCLWKRSDQGYLMNLRHVNYHIGPDGSYDIQGDQIISWNTCLVLDSEFNIVEEIVFPVGSSDQRYLGVEDVRLFPVDKASDSDPCFIGTIQHHNGRLGLGLGTYPVSTPSVLKPRELRPDFVDSECEKNWVCVEIEGDELRIVYSWNPMRICELVDPKGTEGPLRLHCVRQIETPYGFRYYRGSTCGCRFGNEMWFVVHFVADGNPRQYYHVFVVFDAEMTRLLRTSCPFTFEDQPIEYCLGLCVEPDRVVCSYSTWDRTSKIAVFSHSGLSPLFQE